MVSMDELILLKAASEALRETESLAKRRNELLVRARDAGASWLRIQEASGLTRQAAYTAYQRAKSAESKGGEKMTDMYAPCRVCGSDVRLVRKRVEAAITDKGPQYEEVRYCNNPRCESNDRDCISWPQP